MNSFLGGFGALWEIDLWGRVRRMNEAARANFMAYAGRPPDGDDLTGQRRRAGPTLSCWNWMTSLRLPRRTRDSYERTFKLLTTSMPAAWLRSWRFPAPNWRCARSRPTSRKSSAKSRLKENEINTLLGRNPGPVRSHLNPAGPGDAGGNPGGTALDVCWSAGPTFGRPSSRSARPTRKSAWPLATSSRASA